MGGVAAADRRRRRAPITRWVDADAVAGELKPGMTVFVAGATAEPREILEALARGRPPAQ